MNPHPADRERPRRRRTNIDKQEKLVSLMWSLCSAAQRNEPGGCLIISNGIRMADATLRHHLAEIMDLFGYDVLEVQ